MKAPHVSQKNDIYDFNLHSHNRLGFCSSFLSHCLQSYLLPLFFFFTTGSSCSPLSVGQHVEVQDSCTQAPSPPGTVCDLSCPANYKLIGPPFQQCGDQGVWSPPSGPISCHGMVTFLLTLKCSKESCMRLKRSEIRINTFTPIGNHIQFGQASLESQRCQGPMMANNFLL